MSVISLYARTSVSMNGQVNDMFWATPMNMSAIDQHCNSTLGVVPRPDWIAEEFGGAASATNIVFSNGLYDPWSSGMPTLCCIRALYRVLMRCSSLLRGLAHLVNRAHYSLNNFVLLLMVSCRWRTVDCKSE